jgi:hypothetical protein
MIYAALIAAAIALTVSAQAKDVKTASSTVVGEVVDTGCYLAHGARGAANADCGTKCVSQGMPMGVLTSQGALYLVTMSHDNPAPYNSLKALVGKDVSVTGTVHQRAGLKAIEISSSTPTK